MFISIVKTRCVYVIVTIVALIDTEGPVPRLIGLGKGIPSLWYSLAGSWRGIDVYVLS